MTPDHPFDEAQMRADLAAILGIAPEALASDTNLLDAGLDSMRAMTVIGQWMDAGVAIDFGDLVAAAPTPAGWWRVIAERRARA